MKDFWELEVWKRAYSLHHWVYALIDSYPSVALDEMAPRMRQASLAIAAEIAEGCGAYQNNGGRRHFNAALGAVSALDCLMFLAYDMRLIPSGCAKHFLGFKLWPLPGLNCDGLVACDAKFVRPRDSEHFDPRQHGRDDDGMRPVNRERIERLQPREGIPALAGEGNVIPDFFIGSA